MKEFVCSECDKKFESEESLKQHNQAKHSFQETDKKTKRSVKKYLIITLIIISLVIFSYTIYLRIQKIGAYDDFAKCLSSKGVVIYGNDFCQYTAKQLNMFGKSEKYLDYVKCVKEKELCDNKKVKITPTWEINGEMYEGVQSFERLAELSRCEL